jgi:hypothetical protein
MKSIYTLAIVLCVCVSLSLGATPAGSTESATSGALAAGAVATKVYSAGNATDAPNWNAYGATPAGTTGVAAKYVWFGPGATNGTAYVYGAYAPAVPSPAPSPSATAAFTKLIKRTLNASIIANGTDTTEAANSGDAVITITSPAAAVVGAVGPGYLAILSHGNDGTNNDEVYINLVSGTSSTATMVTAKSSTDATSCTGSTTYTTTTYGLGNIWYDIGSSAFYYTYYKQVASQACSGGSTSGSPTNAYTVYLGGLYTNGSAVYTNPGLAFTTNTAANAVGNVIGGGDNWLAASNIWVVYKDSVANTIYYSKVARNATAGGSFNKLIADDATSNAAKTYTPLAVWASNFTYGIAVAVANQTAAAAYNYPIQNYLNGSTTATDSGLSYTGVTTSGGGALMFWGWPLTTGYTLAAAWTTSTANTPTYVYGTFYANGTVNMTQTTIGGFQGMVSFYEDVNGSFWLGYEDIDTANSGLTYAGYLAKLQNQINSATSSGAKLFAFTWAVVALIFISLI